MKEYQIQEAFCSKLRLLIISHLITKKLLFTELKKLTEMGIQQFEEYVDFLESVIKGKGI